MYIAFFFLFLLVFGYVELKCCSGFYIGQSSHQTHSTVEASKTNMLRGTLFLLGSCLSYTAWFIVQVCFPFIPLTHTSSFL
ncbi:hypothetical protein GLYMA_16G131750v4 [Glycine max]|nr:hypothetical protein GLYMA_16G131750v4 [Glycine max]